MMKKNTSRLLDSALGVFGRMKTKTVRGYAGVSGFGWKFAAVFLLYAFAFAFMGKDPWYGAHHFEWEQGFFVLLISFFIVSTLSFDWKLLGPTKGSNCLLSLFLMVPFALFIGRIMGKAAHTELEWSVLGEALDKVKGLGGFLGLSSIIPKWVQEVFSSPGTALMLVGVSAALAVRNKIAQKGLLLTALLMPFLNSFAYEPRVSYWFIIGMMFMFSGMTLQFMDMNRYHWSAVLLEAFENVNDVAERKSSIRVMEYVRKHGRMSDKALYAMIGRCYRDEHWVGDADLHQITVAMAQRLVSEHGLLRMETTNDGQHFVLNKTMFYQEDSLAEIIRWPRNIIIGIIALLWLLSPIDIIPDTLPGGTIDDALISFLGFSPLMQQIAGAVRHRGARTMYEVPNE